MAGTGNPGLSQFRHAFGTQEGGPTSAWTDFLPLSESLGVELPTIEDDSIRPGGEQAEGLPSKIDPSGSIEFNWRAEQHHRMIAAFFGLSATPAESPTGVWTHKHSVAETDVTFDPLLIEVSRDLARPEVYREMLPRQIVVTTAPRSLVNGSVELVGPRMDMWADAAEVAVTATPNAPRLRGWPSYANLTSADGDVYVRVEGAPSGNDITVSTKLGAASAYSGTQVVVAGQWSPAPPSGLFDESGAHIGSVDLPVQIYFPDATLTDQDEWRFDRERAVWVPNLASDGVLNEISCYVSVDGVTFRLREFTLTATRPVELDEAIGGRFIDDTIERGDRTAVLEINRAVIDNSMVNRLLRAKSFEAEVRCLGEPIAATGVPRELKFTMKNLIPGGKTPSVSGKTTFDESITATAHPSEDVTYPSALTAEVINSIADLTA